MASIETEGLPLAAPATDPWPRTELGDYSARSSGRRDVRAQARHRVRGRGARFGDGPHGPASRGRAGRHRGDDPASGRAEGPLSGAGAGPAPEGHRRIAEQQPSLPRPGGLRRIIAAMPPPTARMETYRALDQAVVLHALSATLDGPRDRLARSRHSRALRGSPVRGSAALRLHRNGRIFSRPFQTTRLQVQSPAHQ